MKKIITILSLAALALTVSTTAFAEDEGDHGWINAKSHLEAALQKGEGKHLGIIKHLDDSKFVLTGAVAAVGSNSLTVNVKASAHVEGLVYNLATVAVTGDTKITMEKDQVVVLSSITAGQQVVVQGQVSGSVLTAARIHVLEPKKKAFGEVTAKTDNSITIKNNVTGITQTFTTDGETKVAINGEAKTLTDVQVGDKGMVKFKTAMSGFIAKFISLFR